MARQRSFARSIKRRKVWTNTDVDYIGTGKTAVDLLSSYRAQPGAVGAGLTVMTVVFQHRAEVETAAIDTWYDLGLIVDRAPATAVPAPGDDEYADWMWNTRYYVDKGAATGHWESPDVTHQQVRSRRKVDEVGDTLFLAIDPNLGTGVGTMHYVGHFRVLLALP